MARAKTSHRPAVSKPATVAGLECLLEIGVEELPHQFIAPALTALVESARHTFTEHRLAHAEIRTVGTPRRLVLVVAQLATRQTPASKEAMGPSKAIAFDFAGQPITSPPQSNWTVNQGPGSDPSLPADEITTTYVFVSFMFVPDGLANII